VPAAGEPRQQNRHSIAPCCLAGAGELRGDRACFHSTGHESRLKRDLGGAFGKPRCAREELVAESGAVLGSVLLGDRLEIGSEIESHAAYHEFFKHRFIQ